MRDYTYIEGYRFIIWNIYRSKRFDVDRLDINFADKDMPEFVRGYQLDEIFDSEPIQSELFAEDLEEEAM